MNFREICLVLSPLMYPLFICAMHAVLSSNNVVGLSLEKGRPHDS